LTAGPRDLPGTGDDAGRRDAVRYAVTFGLSLLVNLLLLLFVSLAADPSTLDQPPEIAVPVVFEQPEPVPEPQPEPVEEQPAPEPEPEPEPEEQPPPESLLGFESEGEVEAEPVRPPGPEAERLGPPDSADEPEEVTPEPLPEEPAPEIEPESEPELEEPAPEVESEPPQPEASPPVEAPEEENAPRPRDEPEPLRELPPVQPRPVPRDPPVPRPAPPDRLDTRVEGGFFGDVQFDSKDYNWSDYTTKLYFAVYRAWLRELWGRVPRFERDQLQLDLARIEGEVVIHFVLHRDGGVTGIDVRRPSVLPTLDEASQAALQRAVIPPLPDDFPRNTEGVTFRFVMKGFESSQQLRRRLLWERRRIEY
jgi:TonB family protein